MTDALQENETYATFTEEAYDETDRTRVRRPFTMISVEVTPHQVIFSLQGWDMVFALKRQVTIPRSCIDHVEMREIELRPNGLRIPGTYIPGWFAAGTYRRFGRKEFWSVRLRQNDAVVLDLHDHEFSRVVIDVDDPAGLIAELS